MSSCPVGVPPHVPTVRLSTVPHITSPSRHHSEVGGLYTEWRGWVMWQTSPHTTKTEDPDLCQTNWMIHLCLVFVDNVSCLEEVL